MAVHYLAGDEMRNIKSRIGLLVAYLFAVSAFSEVRVFVQESNSLAWIKYECTAGEVVRAFALNVSVDEGSIVGISDFFKGPCTEEAQGYGIFPASLRDHITIGSGTAVSWDVNGYTPLAVPADDPENTLPGLNSRGVTLEFGALWNPAAPATIPGPTGTLCSLRISKSATVSVTPNQSRGGIVGFDPEAFLAPVFTGELVQPPEITGLSLEDGVLTITFAGGELETAPAIAGPWTGTGNTSGQFLQSVGDELGNYFRVRNP